MSEQEPRLDPADRDRILSAEIAGLLHDLGKLRPEFAADSLAAADDIQLPCPKPSRKAKKNAEKRTGVELPHGAILEAEHRLYPPPNEEPWLAQLYAHEGWRERLAIPEAWLRVADHEQLRVQARGLGDPLRQHHANEKYFPKDDLGLLGDLFTFGADGRDSALDKGSGNESGTQRAGRAFQADTFGREAVPYDPEDLDAQWQFLATQLPVVLFEDPGPADVPETWRQLRGLLSESFCRVLGETRRPTNDVTLWDHSFATASLFKAATAERTLCADFSDLQEPDGLVTPGGPTVRFRLLGIRWDWAALVQGALRPVAWTALRERRDRALKALRTLLEERFPIGNIVYEDDAGVVLAVPGFYRGADAEAARASEARFEQQLLAPLYAALTEALEPLGAGTPFRVAWSAPTPYLTEFPAVLPSTLQGEERERLWQVGGRSVLEDLWQHAAAQGSAQICPLCGRRPAWAREWALSQSGIGTAESEERDLCSTCGDLESAAQLASRWRQAETTYGFTPRTFNLQQLRQERAPANARLALISVQLDLTPLFDGSAFISQLARGELAEPQLRSKPGEEETHSEREQFEAFWPEGWPSLRDSFQARGDFLQRIWERLTEGGPIERGQARVAQHLVGDEYWLSQGDGRSLQEGWAERAREVAEQFFLREAVSLDEGLGLVRHVGDQLALFGMRKHPSLGRLQRTLADLDALWGDLLAFAAEQTGAWTVPLSRDAHGIRLIVAADDARPVLEGLRERLNERLARVRDRIAPQVSAVLFREKFPLYLAMDALYRLETRPVPDQWWTLREKAETETGYALTFETPQGEIHWSVPTTTGDPAQSDRWHPFWISGAPAAGPGRLRHVEALEPGDPVAIRPMTFDFVSLETAGQRFAITHDRAGRRPHLVFGEPGRPAHLLDRLEDLLRLVPETLIDEQGWGPARRKAIHGELVERYEHWIRDAPSSSHEAGWRAYEQAARSLLRRYCRSAADAEWLLPLVQDGRLFDALEWTDFFEKRADSAVSPSEPSAAATEGQDDERS